jgi:hypothetical protein
MDQLTKHTFHGALTRVDFKKHIAHPFDVPEGTNSIRVHMSYSPAKIGGIDNHLVISLFDPAKSRGSRHYPGDLVHGNIREHHIRIDTHSATYGFMAGEIQPGIWTAMIHTNMVLPAAPIQYTLEVLLGRDSVVKPTPSDNTSATSPALHAPYTPHTPPRTGPGWFKGDLHAHTLHSDGDWDIADLIEEAVARKLDFVTLTDHNTASGLAQMRNMTTPNLLAMGGIELTTFYGHALALGVDEWIDWRVNDQRKMPDIVEDVNAQGGTFIIAHPMTEGDPICTGCDWTYDDMMPGNAKLIEVWNSGLWPFSRNEQSLQLYYRWLNQGHRLVATAGTDTHGPASLEIQPGLNVVYAEALNEQAILHAVRLGHLYLSNGPTLVLTAHNTAGETAMMGDVLHGNAIDVNVEWHGTHAHDVVRVLVSGTVREEFTSDIAGRCEFRNVVDSPMWCCVELRDADGNLRALTNPIFLTA